MPQTNEELSSESEWEDVKEHPVVNAGNIQVDVEVPDIIKKKKKKQATEREMMEIMVRRAANKFNKEKQTNLHKVHLLGLLSTSLRLNELCNFDEMKSLALSILPLDVSNKCSKNIDEKFLKLVHASVISWFHITDPVHELKSHGIVRFGKLQDKIRETFEKNKIKFKLDFILIFIMILRSLNIETRLVSSIQPITFKVLTEKQRKDQNKKSGTVAASSKTKKKKTTKSRKRKSSEVIPQLDGAGDSPPKRMTRQRRKAQQEKEEPEAKKSAVKKETAKTKDVKKSNVKVKKVAEKRSKDVKEEENFSDKENKNTKNKRKRKAKVEIHQSIKDEMVNKSIDETPVPVCTPPEVENTNKRRLRARKSLTQKQPKIESDDENDDDFKALSPSSHSDSSSSDFEEPKIKVKRESERVVTKSPYFNKSSSSSPPATQQKRKIKSKIKHEEISNEWIEVYFDNEHKWVTFDPLRCKIDEPLEIESSVTEPMQYVVAMDNDGSVKDITARYAANWLTATRKLRIGWMDKDWWKNTLMPFQTKNEMRDGEENRQLHSYLMSLPLPTSIQAYKDHPLFALRRHILKYESIYPANISAVGYVRGEEIFPRSAVHILHTQDKWLQHARTVCPGEKPYKMVASLWRNMKLKQDNATLSLPLFGRWQTVPYEPPIASGGKVPRNDFGNVDLFQAEMLPVGCVHLRMNNLPKVAKKLNIDIAPAIVGFDTHSGYPHPVNDGYVVCEEYQDALVEAWKEEEVRSRERKAQRREERIYGNWKQLIRGILVKEKISKKYKLNNNVSPQKKGGKKSKITSPSSAWQADKLIEAKQQEKTKTRRGRRKNTKSNEDFPFEFETL